jgi:hypothetical protein
MTLKALFLNGCVSAAMVISTVPAMAAVVHECVAGKPNPASYTWDFKAETNTIFQDIQSDAQQALDHADQLQGVQNAHLSWDSQGLQLDAIKDEVNDIEAKICRLETIRRVVAPWQKKEIDRIAATTRLMVDNTQDAILFGNAHQENLWLATYRKYTDNLDAEAQNLANSVGRAVEYANVSKEYRNLRHGMQASASS